MKLHRSTKKAVRLTQQLAKLVETFILEHGGQRADWAYAEHWSLETSYGALGVSVPVSDIGYMTIFGRFEDVDRAKTGVRCNPYSGKWNFHAGHYSEGATPEQTFEDWRRRVEPLLNTAPRLVGAQS